MSKVENSEDIRVTKDSWRKKFYGLIQDGHKSRVSPLAIKIGGSLLTVVVLVIQFLSPTRFTKRTQKSLDFDIPQTIEPDQRMNIPLHLLGRSGSAENSRQGKFKTKEVQIERLRPIRLSGSVRDLTALQVPALLSMGGSNGMVIAQTTSDLTQDGEMIFPQGTKLYGKGNSSDERLYIEFKKAILPDRTSQKIKAQGLDANDQQLGIKGKKISDVAFKIAASSGLIFLSGIADGLKQDQSIFRKPSIQDAALNGIATAASKQGDRVLQSMDQDSTKVEVKVRTSIIVMFDDLDGKE